MAEGSIKNVGDWKSPFDAAKTPSQGISSEAMGMRGSDVNDRLKPALTVQVPPSTGGSGGIQNVGQLDPGAKKIK